jgi:hypothetical protein
MARFKAMAFVNGAETEVELDDTLFITQETHRARMTRTINDRLAKQAVNLRKELLADGDFQKEAMKAAGVDPTKIATGAGLTEADVARLQAEWRTKELDPVKAQLATATDTLSKDRTRTKSSQLEAALGDAGVKKAVRKRIAEIEAARFEFDDKSGQFAQRGEDGEFLFSTKATQTMPFVGIEEFATAWAANPENVDFVEQQTQKGPNVGAPPPKGSTQNSGTPPTGLFRSTMDAATKSKFIGEHGLEKFRALPLAPTAA